MPDNGVGGALCLRQTLSSLALMVDVRGVARVDLKSGMMPIRRRNADRPEPEARGATNPGLVARDQVTCPVQAATEIGEARHHVS